MQQSLPAWPVGSELEATESWRCGSSGCGGRTGDDPCAGCRHIPPLTSVTSTARLSNILIALHMGASPNSGFAVAVQRSRTCIRCWPVPVLLLLLLLLLLLSCGVELSGELRCPLPQGRELLELDAL